MRRRDDLARVEIDVRELRSDLDRVESKMKLLSVEWDDMLVRLQKAYRRVERGNSRSRQHEDREAMPQQVALPLDEASDPFSRKLRKVREQGADTRGVDESAG